MAEPFTLRYELSLSDDGCSLHKSPEKTIECFLRAVILPVGITEDGDREIIGFMIQNEESDDTWSIFFDYLKERGLQGTELIISDAHKGLVSAIRKSFTNASWQRCQVHFFKKHLQFHSKKNSKPFREAVKATL